MPEKISICLKRGRGESVGNDDVSVVCARKYEMVRIRMTSRKNPEGTAWVVFVTSIVQSYFDTLFALRVISASDILWSSCVERYGPKDPR